MSTSAVRSEQRYALPDEFGTSDARPKEPQPVEARSNKAMTRSVLVTHPGLQHSHQLALALHEKNLLQAFWSGVPVAEDEEALPWWLPEHFRKRVRRVGIPAELRLHPFRFQVLQQASMRVKSGHPGDRLHRLFHGFDAWAAKRIVELRPKVVVAYENAAYHTFAAAKSVGARCVLDAAAFHHKTRAEQLAPTYTPYTAEVNRRKDVEIAMADLILTCSPLAADSYAANGVERSRLKPLLLGADPKLVTPITSIRRDGPPRFMFAGQLTLGKSIDLILAAFSRLHAEGFRYEVHFVGGLGDHELLAEVQKTPGAHYHPNVPQSQLFELMAGADCLLLPSRSDSFGMVVAEAMSCGTPALVSTQTGAKAIVEAFPESGWVVEPNGDALYNKLRELVGDPASLQRARIPALIASKDFTWERYRARAGRALQEYLQ
ncbi:MULTISPECIES: glycosyltransferase family 4 protein [unclassified Variovorax]|uniref:glycosyltransferase family 4 protein n=1 Tax=unclassified Variovorax TaxID=663243 RepID=UPI001BD32016|nr:MULTISPECIES: glycosyltransferase family 4 protein [unclassified Variovorax]